MVRPVTSPCDGSLHPRMIPALGVVGCGVRGPSRARLGLPVTVATGQGDLRRACRPATGSPVTSTARNERARTPQGPEQQGLTTNRLSGHSTAVSPWEHCSCGKPRAAWAPCEALECKKQLLPGPSVTLSGRSGWMGGRGPTTIKRADLAPARGGRLPAGVRRGPCHL
jgi:hypothetical protein